MPIGCKVTLRGSAAEKLLKDSLWVRENRLPAYCFSKTGGLSFGIPDYTGYKDENYDPDIGIFGLDIAVAFERPGFRVSRRKIKSCKIGNNHRISADECREFMQDKFTLEVFKV
jgi:large subunit ribosomal protein L5